MDPSADPSVDFYQYAAGNWIQNNPVPADKTRWGAFGELTERNYQLIHGLLEASSKTGIAQDPTARMVGEFFRSAMDTDRLEILRLQPLVEDLARIERLSDVPELFEELAAQHRLGMGGLFESFVYPDKRNSTVYAFYLMQGGLSLPDRDYYLNPEFSEQVEAFRHHLARAFAFLGETPSRAEASASAVLSVEHRLAEASRTRTELRDEEKNYHKVSWAEFLQQHPRTPWNAYLARRELASLPYVIVGQPEFFVAVERLLGDVPLAEWKVYLRWQLFHASAPFLHGEVEQADFDFFHRVLRGQQQPEPRWLRVAAVLDADIGEAVGKLFVDRYFPREARARMVELVDDLRAVFRDRLLKVAWMTEETRRKALAKFDRFSTKIGHPEKFRDYSSVRIDAEDYLGNHRRAAEFEIRRQTIRVGQPVDRTEWGMTPPQVNAYFDPTKNEIVFPAGILQPPFFDLSMDDAVNYGGIGAVIGHEITHGYDDQGRKYGADGNLSDWWTEADAAEFGARAERVVEEYDAFTPLPGVHVNGRLTLGENIADLGGVSIAFEALQRRLTADPSRRKIVDDLTPEQRFFVSWAQIWRQNIQEADLRFRLTVDPHSQGRYRAVGAATNMGAFAEAFRLRPGSPMWRDPEQRITIW
jgi:putative endopeptidase